MEVAHPGGATVAAFACAAVVPQGRLRAPLLRQHRLQGEGSPPSLQQFSCMHPQLRRGRLGIYPGVDSAYVLPK
jgi:hypothetical protein